jgi:hypothetical protein
MDIQGLNTPGGSFAGDRLTMAISGTGIMAAIIIGTNICAAIVSDVGPSACSTTESFAWSCWR